MREKLNALESCENSYPSPLRGAPLPQGSSAVRMARGLRETDEICKQLNAASEQTGREYKQANAASKQTEWEYKQANAASEQAGWSCPPKVGGRAKRRGYEQVRGFSSYPSPLCGAPLP